MDAAGYRIDPAMSRFTVRAFASGMLSALGHNPAIAIRDFSGEVKFAPDRPEQTSLHLKIDAKSLAVSDDISDKDRREMERAMNLEVLETARYPEIVFDASKVSANNTGDGRYWVNIEGSLSLHGVTRSPAGFRPGLYERRNPARPRRVLGAPNRLRD